MRERQLRVCTQREAFVKLTAFQLPTPPSGLPTGKKCQKKLIKWIYKNENLPKMKEYSQQIQPVVQP